MEFQITDEWRQSFPGAMVGLLALDGVENPPDHPALSAHAQEVESDLRSRWAGATRADLAQLPELEAYRNYYRRFEKTYHVQLQLESVIWKAKPLRSNGALVTAMFISELQNLLLTAGHDLDRIEGPLSLDVTRAEERFTGIGGRELSLRGGDMLIRDGAGTLSVVLYGPDERTRLTERTRRALFTTYCPPGIDPAVLERHLDDLAHNVRLVSPGATTLYRAIYTSNGSEVPHEQG